MANDEQLAKLKEGVEAWNRWRKENPDVRPDLSGANLRLVDLSLGHPRSTRGNGDAIDLSFTDLSRADLFGSTLSHANLTGANLSRANLFRVDLARSTVVNALLDGVHAVGVNFAHADLTGTSIGGANLADADFQDATLVRTCFWGSGLMRTRFLRPDMTEAVFNHAWTYETVFSGCDLSTVRGLESVQHIGPSAVDYHTLVESNGEIPEEFVIGTGYPESQIKNILATVRALSPIEFYSCFISYSSKDEAFVKRLHSRLRDAQVRTWYAPEDLRGGRETVHQIDQAIRLHDKLLLVLSKHSMSSDWVEHEIYKALKHERETGKQMLFPISLVPFARIKEWECFDPDSGKDMARVIRRYHIPDFRTWKSDHDKFEEEFTKLLEALQRDDDAADQS